MEESMRIKLITILLTIMMLITSIPALAGGDKVHGDKAVGPAHQNQEQGYYWDNPYQLHKP
jgi:hypothetical protein